MSFIIAGHGRAGTVWISRMLNTYGDHAVLHESHWADPVPVWDRLRRPLQGEVNNSLTGDLAMFLEHGIKVGIMIRNPIDQIRSHAKRAPVQWRYFKDRLGWYRTMHELISTGKAVPIRMEEVTRTYGHLCDAAKRLGVEMREDACLSDFETPRNNDGREPRSEYDWPKVVDRLQWFTDIYYS